MYSTILLSSGTRCPSWKKVMERKNSLEEVVPRLLSLFVNLRLSNVGKLNKTIKLATVAKPVCCAFAKLWRSEVEQGRLTLVLRQPLFFFQLISMVDILLNYNRKLQRLFSRSSQALKALS